MPYSLFQLAGKYFQYKLRAKNGKGHGMHSPFVFDFIRNVLSVRYVYPDYERVEHLRRSLLNETRKIDVIDLGAGSGKSSGKHRSISSIARNAAKPAKFGQLLYRMVRYYKPDCILELGTSLGISSCYLQLGNPTAELTTLEGSPAIAAEARVNFQQLQLTSIQQVTGNFDDTLQDVLKNKEKLDFVFVDGNHQLDPTVRYFEQLLPHLHNDSILIFDDIHWSAEMEEAWNQIKKHASVRCTVDLFFIGIVFFRQEFKEPQHFQVQFA